MAYYNDKVTKNENLKKNWPLIEHNPHWINFIISILKVKYIYTPNTYTKFRRDLFCLKWNRKGKSILGLWKKM
jgi:hypothetical protein